ncbi:MAG TPA: response regulator transcription factor [Actinomycetota bacterium]|jgi:DNA-binding response OmpR family regulator
MQVSRTAGLHAETPVAQAPRILLIDDEPLILNFVARGFRAEGFDVDTAERAIEGLSLATRFRYDVVVLDLLMPELDGVSLLRLLLDQRPEQAIIVLSAVGETASKVRCLGLGAEDYIVKPFVLDELLARVRARLRRVVEPSATTISAGGVRLDLIRRQADSGSGAVSLATREFLLLRELIANGGSTVSKERLLSAVWGYYFDGASNVVDVYVARLRRKLGADVIVTVRGEGYRVDGD